ncbi:MAG: hypothetical protein ACR2MX_15900 [Cyclobacteriaceae bacterium]
MLALLLPLAFIWAYMVTPEHSTNPLTLVVDTDELFLVKHLADQGTTGKLEINIQQPLTAPSTLVYITDPSNPDIGKAILIGSLGPKGRYLLNLPATLPRDPVILFYDAINKKVYHQIDFL